MNIEKKLKAHFSMLPKKLEKAIATIYQAAENAAIEKWGDVSVLTVTETFKNDPGFGYAIDESGDSFFLCPASDVLCGKWRYSEISTGDIIYMYSWEEKNGEKRATKWAKRDESKNPIPETMMKNAVERIRESDLISENKKVTEMAQQIAAEFFTDQDILKIGPCECYAKLSVLISSYQKVVECNVLSIDTEIANEENQTLFLCLGEKKLLIASPLRYRKKENSTDPLFLPETMEDYKKVLDFYVKKERFLVGNSITDPNYFLMRSRGLYWGFDEGYCQAALLSDKETVITDVCFESNSIEIEFKHPYITKCKEKILAVSEFDDHSKFIVRTCFYVCYHYSHANKQQNPYKISFPQGEKTEVIKEKVLPFLKRKGTDILIERYKNDLSTLLVKTRRDFSCLPVQSDCWSLLNIRDFRPGVNEEVAYFEEEVVAFVTAMLEEKKLELLKLLISKCGETILQNFTGYSKMYECEAKECVQVGQEKKQVPNGYKAYLEGRGGNTSLALWNPYGLLLAYIRINVYSLPGTTTKSWSHKGYSGSAVVGNSGREVTGKGGLERGDLEKFLSNGEEVILPLLQKVEAEFEYELKILAYFLQDADFAHEFKKRFYEDRSNVLMTMIGAGKDELLQPIAEFVEEAKKQNLIFLKKEKEANELIEEMNKINFAHIPWTEYQVLKGLYKQALQAQKDGRVNDVIDLVTSFLGQYSEAASNLKNPVSPDQTDESRIESEARRWGIDEQLLEYFLGSLPDAIAFAKTVNTFIYGSATKSEEHELVRCGRDRIRTAWRSLGVDKVFSYFGGESMPDQYYMGHYFANYYCGKSNPFSGAEEGIFDEFEYNHSYETYEEFRLKNPIITGVKMRVIPKEKEIAQTIDIAADSAVPEGVEIQDLNFEELFRDSNFTFKKNKKK